MANPSVDNAYGGAFVARHCVEAADLCASMAYWTASDIFEELGLPHAPYSGTYGLLTIQGIPKATFHAMAMVARMQGLRLMTEQAQPLPVGCGLVVTQTGAAIHVLLWNCPRLDDGNASAWRSLLSLAIPFAQPILIKTRLGAGSGSAYETWVAMGRPHNLAPIEEALLRAHAQPSMSFELMTRAEASAGIPVEVGVNEVLAIEIREAGQPGPSKRLDSSDVVTWNAGMGEAAKVD